MEEWIVDYLIKNNLYVSTVESCTGGMIASSIVNVSGASSVFNEGYITYSEKAKQKIAFVNPITIEKYNVVSEEVAHEMAIGGAKQSGADLVISVTGVAGPSGGTNEIPVGTVCIGCYYKNDTFTRKYVFSGDRMSIRVSATSEALKFAQECIKNKESLN